VPRIKSAKKACEGASPQPAQPCQSSTLRTALSASGPRPTRAGRRGYRVAARLLDRAARKNLIHHNNAASTRAG